MCELQLIKGVEKGTVKKTDLENDFERIQIEMPHLYKALDMKGWLTKADNF